MNSSGLDNIIAAPDQRRTPVSTFSLLCFLATCLVPLALAWRSIFLLSSLVQEDGTFSQIPLIPFISAFLIYERRQSIFESISHATATAIALIFFGGFALAAGQFSLFNLGVTNAISASMLGIVLIWSGLFAAFFGEVSLRKASFPLFFLLFMVPIPEPLLSGIISFLRTGSAYMTEIFFRIARVPYFRNGFVFELPRVSIQIAEECSGIRSTLALLITVVLSSYLFLRTSWRRWVLCLAVIPTAIFKNGLRIATLSILSIYVDPGFLYGNLHTRGGIVFFIIALLPMALLGKFLMKSESAQNISRAAEFKPASGD